MQKLTIRDVAKTAGVSTATISRVINKSGYVSDDVRGLVENTIRELGYRPNAIARSLKQEKTRSIGLVVPDMTNPYFMTMAKAIQRRLISEGYHLLMMDCEEDAGKELEALQFLLEKRVEAIIIAGTSNNLEQVSNIVEGGTFIVLIDRVIDGLSLDIISENNVDVSKEAILYLVEKGHSRIGEVLGPLSVSTARERHEGFCAGIAAAGLHTPTDLEFKGNYTRLSGIAAATYFMGLSDPPTAIFSANNEMTFGLYLGLQQLGHRLDLVEVVSFGALEFSPLFEHRLTVIKQNPVRIGEAAGEIVMKEQRGERLHKEKLVFFPTLERRE